MNRSLKPLLSQLAVDRADSPNDSRSRDELTTEDHLYRSTLLSAEMNSITVHDATRTTRVLQETRDDD